MSFWLSGPNCCCVVRTLIDSRTTKPLSAIRSFDSLPTLADSHRRDHEARILHRTAVLIPLEMIGGAGGCGALRNRTETRGRQPNSGLKKSATRRWVAI